MSTSSSISLLFRRLYSSSRSISSAYNLIFNETDLNKVAQTFIKYTQRPQMRKKSSFYEYTIQRLANAKCFNLIEQVLEDQKQYNEIKDEGFNVRLITLYGKSGMFDHALKVFDEMPERNCGRTVISFNALLGACVSSRNCDKAYGFWTDLPRKLLIEPNLLSFNTLIKALCEVGSLDLALSMVGEMEKSGLKPDLITFNVLLDGFYKRRFKDGDFVWGLMRKYDLNPDVVSYNAKLYGLVSEGLVRDAVALVRGMKLKGLKLDVYSYNLLFRGLCSDGKYMDEAKRWFDEMMKTKCAPNVGTFTMLLRFACDNNDFWFGSRLFRGLMYRKMRLKDGALLQEVVDGLVKQSNIREAEILVRFGKGSKHSCYHKVRMPNKFDK